MEFLLHKKDMLENKVLILYKKCSCTCIILYRYIRKVMFSNMMMVFVILVSLSSIIRLIDELRKMEEQEYSLCWMIVYLCLSLPKDLELFLPTVILLGGLLGLGMLEVYNEFIIMQVFGISKLHIAMFVLRSAIPILLCGVVVNEWVLPNSDKILCVYKRDMQCAIKSVPEKKLGNFFWLIDNDCFVCIEQILAYDKLLGVTLYYFDKDKKLKKIFFVECAVFINNVWNLLNVNELNFSTDVYVTNKKLSCIEWHAILKPDMLFMLLKDPHVLSISKLYYCIKYLNRVGQNSKYCQLIFWNKILSPFFGLVMLITALSCTFGPLYQKSINIRLFFGAIVGFIFYILNQIFGILSVTYFISPIVGAILSAMIFLVINIIVIWRYY